MRTLVLLSCFACLTAPAFAQSGAESAQRGAESIESGASVAAEGSAMIASGAAAPGAVSIALGGGSMAAGSVAVVGGAGSMAVEATAQGASAAIDALFSAPVTVTQTTIVAQPAPKVPYEAQTAPAGQ